MTYNIDIINLFINNISFIIIFKNLNIYIQTLRI